MFVWYVASARTMSKSFIEGFREKRLCQVEENSPPALKGVRFQLFSSLKHLHAGRPMFVEWKIPDMNKHLDDAEARETFLAKVAATESWLKAPRDCLKPVFVPGTFFDAVIGGIILKNGWCEPVERHWIPNVMKYVLTEKGIEAFRNGLEWYSSLSLPSKVLVRFTE